MYNVKWNILSFSVFCRCMRTLLLILNTGKIMLVMIISAIILWLFWPSHAQMMIHNCVSARLLFPFTLLYVSESSLEIWHFTKHQGPVVKSIISLTSSLDVKMLTVLHVVSMISNSQVVFSKKFSIYAIFNDHMLTNNILSFEQLGADYLFVCSGVFCCFCCLFFFFQ